ncbi:oxidoreductase [Algimonas arctica]|uniref:Oxidoreductase n=1 Tax=Algimonas arctica TaxID=1479486 RepID=A0A8J3CPD9_9PROT|nr:oxidoreductase [Algimonas arctica]GHA81740.1 oxidoreductase [Algimonas arctica]
MNPKPLFKSVKSGWTPDRVGDQSGKTILITGGNSGIGLEAAKILASKGADILLCARTARKGDAAVAEVNALGGGKARLVLLDLADMASIHACAQTVASIVDRLDVLINNAGVMQTPRMTTSDGFELQLGTNHLGHFLLNGLLFPLVEKANGRIVTVSSIAHKFGRLNLNDLMYAKGRYNPSIAYGQSKLANIVYAFELQRRLDAAGSDVTSYAVHPGYSDTALQSSGPKGLLNLFYKPLNALLAQPAKYGAYPTVLAAVEPKARPGGYYGPTRFQDMRGPVGDSAVHPKALREDKARTLWALSEDLVSFDWSTVLKTA